MNLAQTSVYQVKVQPPLGVETLLGGLYKKSGRDIDLLCTETTLPGSSLATHDVTADYHGVTEKMAYRRIYDDVMDMTFYVDKGYKVIDFFDGWINYISGMGLTASYNSYNDRRSGYRMSYPNTYKTDIFVTKFEKNIADNALYYKFIDAFPIAMNSMAVSYGDSEILKVNVSFSYVRYTKQNLSPSAKVGSNVTPVPIGSAAAEKYFQQNRKSLLEDPRGKKGKPFENPQDFINRFGRLQDLQDRINLQNIYKDIS